MQTTFMYAQKMHWISFYESNEGKRMGIFCPQTTTTKSMIKVDAKRSMQLTISCKRKRRTS